MYIQCNTEARLFNHCYSGKEIIIIYSGCVFVALVIQHEKRMSLIVICGLPSYTIFFQFIQKNGRIFEEKCYWTLNVFFDFIYNFCMKHFLFLEEMIGMLPYMHLGLHVKYLLFMSDFSQTWIFLTDFREVLKYKISWKSIQWGAKFFHAVGRMDMTKLIPTFRNFVNAPKTCKCHTTERPRFSFWLCSV
jgi:hypothetical protein